MQERWHTRRARLLGRRLNVNSCGKTTPISTASAVKSPVPPPAPQHPPQNPPNGRVVFNECFGPDLALEEAIRRSLEDQEENTQPNKIAESVGTESKPAVEVETVLEHQSVSPVNVDTETNISVVAEPLVMAEVVVQPVFEPEIVVDEPKELIDSVHAPPVASAPVESMLEDCLEAKTDFYSFRVDGEGATADIIGSTLDKMAEAIEGLTLQLDRPIQSDMSNSEELNVDVDSDDDSSFSSEANENIIDGDDDFDDDDSGSWHVVPGDEVLGRMASALGSALFNSEMQRSSEALPQPTKSVTADGFDGSTVSSIGTSVANVTISSTVPSVQLERWSAQLNQLHELGFGNDQQSVDILETLTAANIGVDNNEEVSVERVINTIMKD
jgi:hypothetical protein